MKGAWGEQAARAFLTRRGYAVLETNFRTRFGEIDIIAQDGKYIVFVEVKTRKDARFAAAREHDAAKAGAHHRGSRRMAARPSKRFAAAL